MNSSSRPHILTCSLDILPDKYQTRIARYCVAISISEFSKNPEVYKDKIRGILTFPITDIEVTEDLLKQLPNVKVISNYGVGTNHLDFDLFRRYGLRLCSLGSDFGDCVADFAMAMLMAAARRIPLGIDKCRQGIGIKIYPAAVYKFPLGVKVTGSTIGIIGMGSIGYRLAEIAAGGFQMRVLYHNRTRREAEKEDKVTAIYYRNLDEMLPETDFLVITCPITMDTIGMIGHKQFRLMKQTAIVINIARGSIIDQDALVEALKNGTIGGAALDVTTPEPLPRDHDLLKMSNVIMTPHIANATTATRYLMLEESLTNLLAGIEGKPMPREVDVSAQGSTV